MPTGIKLGFGFYHHMLTAENYRFARQCGATHAVVHLVDYFGHAREGDGGQQSAGANQPLGGDRGWGRAGGSDDRWTLPALRRLVSDMAAEGLEVAAIENFDPAHWYDVLLDGPRKREQLDRLKQIIRDLGAAGIPVMGYNFSLAGVASRISGPFARGGAVSVGMDGVDDTPMPNGMVWNMVWDEDAEPGVVPTITHDQLWARLGEFLAELVPVAEEAGVRLAAHPDDPPAPYVRAQPRLVYQPQLYRRLLDLQPSRANALEFCLGSLAEMTDGDVHAVTEEHAAAGDIAYVHFRNVVGKVPRYHEVFVDEGDIDMARIVEILVRNGYDGVIIPDHTPLMAGPAGWHAGMAYAMGYMRALIQQAEGRREVAPTP
ncbi:MAG: mannonate dehydratase [Trueperaceae bacterium]|nr:mannonate dehydratase [Trueperaceae bacterium]